MAIIQSGATATQWTIDPTSDAGRVTVYDQYGNPMSDINSLGNVLNALNSTVTIVLGGQATLGINVSGTTGTLTLSFEATIDNMTWFSINATPISGGVVVSSTSANGQWIASTAGYYAVRTRISSFSSGSMTVSVVITPTESKVVAQVTSGTTTLYDTNGVPVLFGQSTPASTTLSALNAQQAIKINGLPNLQIQISSASGALQLTYEASMDSTNGTNGTWTNLFANPLFYVTNVSSTGAIYLNNPQSPFLAPINGQFSAQVSGFLWARVRVSSYLSGSAVVTLVLSPSEQPTPTIASPTVITSPNAWLSPPGLGFGTYVTLKPYQSLNVTHDPTSIFYDNFIGQVLDTIFRWNQPVVSGVGASVSLSSIGGLTINPGTAALNNTELSSQASFQTFSVSFQVAVATVQLEAGSFVTGAHRFWGLGTKNATSYSATSPMQDAIGFEINSSGVLNAVVYVNGALTYSQAVSGVNTGLYNIYSIIYKTNEIAWFYVQGQEIPVAFAAIQNGTALPSSTGLPFYFHAINGSSTLSGPMTFKVSTAQIGDYSGNQAPQTITGPQTSDQANPFAATVFVPGELRVQIEPSTIFIETFEGTSLDTTNKWIAPTVAGGATPLNYTSGQLTIFSGTTANGYTLLQSQATFPQLWPGFLKINFNVLIEFPVLTNAYRFWGFGTTPSTPTISNPLIDAVGFELGTNGKLSAVFFASGVRTLVQDLSQSTGNNRQPTDNNIHSYLIFFRDELTYFAIDSFDNIVASYKATKTGNNGPNHDTLPLCALTLANTTPPVSSASIVLVSVFIADTAHNNNQISDGTYGWRKASVNSSGAISVAGSNASGTTALGNPVVNGGVDNNGFAQNISATIQNGQVHLNTVDRSANDKLDQILFVLLDIRDSLLNNQNKINSQ
jgi:hypothetical protein